MPHKKKAGINTDLKCQKCGHRVGRVRVNWRFKWRVFWQAMAIAFILELGANVVMYFIFK